MSREAIIWLSYFWWNVCIEVSKGSDLKTGSIYVFSDNEEVGECWWCRSCWMDIGRLIDGWIVREILSHPLLQRALGLVSISNIIISIGAHHAIAGWWQQFILFVPTSQVDSKAPASRKVGDHLYESNLSVRRFCGWRGSSMSFELDAR